MEFPYGERELDHLRSRDPRLGAAIDRIGHISREVEPDLFSSVIHHIVGQQISMAAQATIWRRFQEELGSPVTPDAVLTMDREQLRGLGVSLRKADYILDFAGKTASGSFDIQALETMEDRQVLETLCSLRGIGPWTAEMLMIFSLQRPDIVSFGDLAILRGMRMLYRHKTVSRRQFDLHCRRYSPYGTTASLYLWAIACGALPELTDPAPAGKKVVKPS